MNANVLIIFFLRKETLYKVFEKVRAAKPSKLFLFCDGPRNENDVMHIDEAKKVVETIDWECDVHRFYSDVNLGCGKGPATAIDWAFSFVDELIILEDDCVPSDSFFPFMSENLSKYKHDERIGLISGFNHLKDYNCGNYSYLFTKTGATLGWGTWKRVWEKYDYYLTQLNDEFLVESIKSNFKDKQIAKKRLYQWKLAQAETSQNKKINYWDIQFGFLKFSNSFLVIVPKTNLICNIGAGFGATHTSQEKVLKWKMGRILNMPTGDLQFPLVHPAFVCCDERYDKKVYRILYKKNKFVLLLKKIKRFLKHAK